MFSTLILFHKIIVVLNFLLSLKIFANENLVAVFRRVQKIIVNSFANCLRLRFLLQSISFIREDQINSSSPQPCLIQSQTTHTINRVVIDDGRGSKPVI
jgi:hypothetical protein